MLRVTVFADAYGDYTSQIFAGLYELRAMGEVEIKYRRKGFPILNPFVNHHAYVLLKLDSEHLSRSVNVCIDLVDGGGVSSVTHLDWSDIYFKRSYRGENYSALDQKKITPFGLHYSCSSSKENIRDRMVMALLSNLSLANLRAHPIRALKRAFGQPVKFALSKWKKPSLYTGFPMTDDIFNVPPGRDAKAQVYYRTRVYSPDMAPRLHASGEIKHINDMRANTIRALKSHFGDRFIGGIRPTAFSLEHYGDCTMQDEIGFQGHLKIMQSSLICVTTSGLFDSIDWKIPEYMAASRCIVSERLKYALPEDLTEGLHILSFSTPRECVEKCQHILDNPDLAEKMREAAYNYFQQNVKAVSIMRNSLQLATRSQTEFSE